MSDINNVTYSGRVGKDPEIETNKDNKEELKFSLAVKFYDFVEKCEKTVWIRCSICGNSFEYAKKNIKKGDLVYVQGKTKCFEINPEEMTRKVVQYLDVSDVRILAKNKTQE